MSQSAAARVATPPGGRRPARAAGTGMPRGGPLRVVAGRPPLARTNAAFAALCVLLLSAGLLALLLLNIELGRGAYTVHRLDGQAGTLTDRAAALRADLDDQRSARNLAARAVALGMVPARTAAFLRLSDGAVLGVAAPGSRADALSVVTRTELTAEQIAADNAAERAAKKAKAAAQAAAKADRAAKAAARTSAKAAAKAAAQAAAQAAAKKAAAKKAARATAR